MHIARRVAQHLYLLRASRHTNKHMQRVFDASGPPGHEVMALILEQDAAIAAEQHWLDANFGRPGCLNASPAADGLREHTEVAKKRMGDGHRGFRHNPETIEKMREARKRQVCGPRSEETRKRLSVAGKGRGKGVPLTEEHKLKLSLANKGRKHSEESRRHMADGQRGVVQSAEQRRKNAEAHRGKPKSPEARENMRKAWVKRKAARAPSTDIPDPA